MSNLTDVIGGANLYGGNIYEYSNDRFCNPNQAIYFKYGYLQIPPGVYFSGDFTLSVWILMKSYQYYAAICDFANGKENDNILLEMYNTSSDLYIDIYQVGSRSNLHSPPLILLNQWYHVTLTLFGTSASVYINGNLKTKVFLLKPSFVTRSSNFIGKSNWVDDAPADAIFDDLKIYQGALTSTQILNDYTISSNNG